MDSFVDVMTQFWQEMDFKIVVAIATWLVVLIAELVAIHRRTGKTPEAQMNKLRQKGHLVEAQRVSVWKDGNKSDVDDYVHAKYTYTVDDKQYSYRYLYRQTPPNKIILYYRNNPSRTKWVEAMLRTNGGILIVQLLLPIVAGVAAYFLLAKCGL